MRNIQVRSLFVGAALLALAPGCVSPEGATIESESPFLDDEAASSSAGQFCVEFCRETAARGCNDEESCLATCAILSHRDCQADLEKFLTCYPRILRSDCTPDFSLDVDCDLQRDYIGCVSHGDFGGELPDGGCVGRSSYGSREFVTACDADGSCTCEHDGQRVGECEAIVWAADACVPGVSCCDVTGAGF